jgi:hypothetical protein
MTTSSHPQYAPSSPDPSLNVTSPATSHTELLDRSHRLKSTSTLDFGRAQGQEANFSRISKGKSKKRVRYNEETQEFLAPRPASPTEVLSRTLQTVDANTSAAATVSFAPGTLARDSAEADVILRGMYAASPFT